MDTNRHECKFLDKLLDGAEAAHLAMGDERVGKFIRGGSLQKKDFVEQGVGCIHYGQLYTHYGTYTKKTKTFVTKEFAQKARMAKKGDVVIATTSENDEDVCKAVAWLGDDDIAVSSDACFFRHNLNPKYVSYFFQTENFQKQKRGYITGAKVRRVNADKLAKIKIPIPCPDKPEKSLTIQAEIVRILDAFTELTTELTTELAARKKQYNYYRDQLLTFEDGEVEWKPLGEHATITIGEFVHKNIQDASAEYPVFNGGRTPTGYYGKYNNTGDKIIVSARGANAGFVNRISEPYWAGNSCYSVGIKSAEELNWSFVYYFLKCSEHKLIGDQQKGGIPAVSKKQMEVFKIPIPFPNDPEKSLAEQARIVAILDKFDILTDSVSEGLPREIELRQKQYEFYRDLLLNFPTPEAQTEIVA